SIATFMFLPPHFTPSNFSYISANVADTSKTFRPSCTGSSSKNKLSAKHGVTPRVKKPNKNNFAIFIYSPLPLVATPLLSIITQVKVIQNHIRNIYTGERTHNDSERYCDCKIAQHRSAEQIQRHHRQNC